MNMDIALYVKTKILIEKCDSNNGDFDLLVGNIQQLVIDNNVKLSDEQVRHLADIYFKLEKSTDRTKQNQRLDNANRIFEEIDHTNNMIIEPEDSALGLFYSMSKYQCDEWQKLILKSIEDLDNREVRIQILQHPFNCEHPTCVQVAKHMKEISK